jgi:hypothetical protein
VGEKGGEGGILPKRANARERERKSEEKRERVREG